ncbi:MAG: hypothetical protein JWR19_3006 [Pedosphaera sp.]|nr:hypothetical protein [Pedosphaera sp.]
MHRDHTSAESGTLQLLTQYSPAFAWSGVGHMVIAAETYRQLSPELQTRVAKILKAHPDYEKWQQSHAKAGSEEVDLATFIFMRASTWPDEIRRGAGSDKQYDHSHWHYVDYGRR